MGKAPCQSFLHACVIIGALNRLDPELPVIALLRSSVFKYHHGCHIFEAVGIGYIESLHPHKALCLQNVLYLRDSPGSPCLFPLYLLSVIVEDDTGIFFAHLKEPGLGPYPGHRKGDLMTALFGKPPFYKLHILRGVSYHYLSGNKRGSRIELLDEPAHDIAVTFHQTVRHMVMLTSHEPSVPDKEDLDNDILTVSCHSDDIPVRSHIAAHLLLLGNAPYGFHQVPVSCSLFELHVIRSFLHLSLQILYDGTVIAVQKFQRPGYLFRVLLP